MGKIKENMINLWGDTFIVTEKPSSCNNCGKPAHFTNIPLKATFCGEDCYKTFVVDYEKWFDEIYIGGYEI